MSLCSVWSFILCCRSTSHSRANSERPRFRSSIAFDKTRLELRPINVSCLGGAIDHSCSWATAGRHRPRHASARPGSFADTLVIHPDLQIKVRATHTLTPTNTVLHDLGAMHTQHAPPPRQTSVSVATARPRPLGRENPGVVPLARRHRLFAKTPRRHRLAAKHAIAFPLRGEQVLLHHAAARVGLAGVATGLDGEVPRHLAVLAGSRVATGDADAWEGEGEG